MIYLDNAATTLHKPKCVIDAVVNAMTTAGNSSRGLHGAGIEASSIVYKARETAARLFNCPRPDHVVFTSNVTESLNISICGLAEPGDHFITTDAEHNSVLRPLYRLEEEKNIEVSFVRPDEKGMLKASDFKSLLRPETKAIICTHASNVTGNLTDIAEVGKIAAEAGVLFIVDAAQTGGSFPIDMQALGIDVLCFTGHKGLFGPQGTGGICINNGVEIKPFKVGGTGVQTYLKNQPPEYPVRLEAGTMNIHGIAGLAAGMDFIMETGISEIHGREMMLMNRFLEGIKNLQDIKLYGDYSHDRAPIVALNIGDIPSAEVADNLYYTYDISVRAGAHCAPRMHEALGTKQQGAVRFSFSYFNTEAEVDLAVKAIKELM